MNVSELIALGWDKCPHPVEVEGHLIISGSLNYLVDSEAQANSGQPHFGLLLPPKLTPLIEGIEGLALYAGSRVQYTGLARLQGAVRWTGLSLLPVSMDAVYELHFFTEPGAPEHYFQPDSPSYSLHLQRPRDLSPEAMIDLKALLAGNSLNLMQLRKLLLGQRETCLSGELAGDALHTATALLDRHGLQYRLEINELRG